MLSHARGSGGYRGASAGHIEASLTGLYPYGRYEASDRLSVWGVAGYGEGPLTVDPEAQAAMETDMGLAMASVGGARHPHEGAAGGRCGACGQVRRDGGAHDLRGGQRGHGQPCGVGGRRDAASSGA